MTRYLNDTITNQISTICKLEFKKFA